MRSRSKVLLAFGATCLSTAVLASGALAHNKHREGGEMSSKGTKALKVDARGTITFSALGVLPATVTVDTGVTGQVPVVCAVTDETRLRGNPITGDTAKVECKSKNGVLTAKKIEKKVVKIEAKGVLALVGGTVTVTRKDGTTVTCSVPTPLPAGMVLPAAGSIVEIKCLGTPPVLAKIELEDEDDD